MPRLQQAALEGEWGSADREPSSGTAQQPISDGQHPGGKAQQPLGDGQHPGGKGQQPVNDRQHPGGKGQQPVNDRQHPGASEQQADNVRHPSGGSGPPSDFTQVAGGVDQHTAATEYPPQNRESGLVVAAVAGGPEQQGVGGAQRGSHSQPPSDAAHAAGAEDQQNAVEHVGQSGSSGLASDSSAGGFTCTLWFL